MPPPLATAGFSGLAPTLAPVAQRLDGLRDGLLAEMRILEDELDGVLAERPAGLARSCARHLLAARGKRVRPFLCMLAARASGKPFDAAAVRGLAAAGELVHAATLLHDDVIDLGDRRRGRATARLLYGNASSVLGGDLLLIEALRRIERAAVATCSSSMLEVLQQMVEAESLQLESRGRTDIGIDDYFRICAGKTASLFAWVLGAGGLAGSARTSHVEALRAFGREVGVAFQLVDDILDLTADTHAIGKAMLQDIRQGTITYPSIAALREEPGLAERLRAAAEEGDISEGLGAELAAAVRGHGGLEDARRQVAAHTTRAAAQLEELPQSGAVSALHTVASELAERAR